MNPNKEEFKVLPPHFNCNSPLDNEHICIESLYDEERKVLQEEVDDSYSIGTEYL